MPRSKLNIEKFLEETALFIDRTVEKYIPRKFDESSLIFTLSPPRYKPDLEALNKAVAEPIWEFLDRGGKRWRPTLFLLVCEALGCDPQRFIDFAIIPEVLHNGTLIADDIEDASESRRGRLCTYKLFGVDIAVNVSDALFFLPMLVLLNNRDKFSLEKTRKIYEVYIQEMINLSFGQAIDIAWHKGLASADYVSDKEYLQMCVYKTGTLARMAAKMASILAGADESITEKMGRFAESIGIAFQIQDDILDLVGEEFARGKGGLGMDITEGKRSFIVIHTLQEATPEDKKRLTTILNMHTKDKRLKDKAIRIIRKYGSIEYAKNFALKIVQDSWIEVDKILHPSGAKEKLRALTNYLIMREI